MKNKKLLALVLALILMICAFPFDTFAAGIGVSSDTYTGWWQENNKWIYYENGVIVTDRWVKDSKGLVYIGSDGYMVTDKWLKDSVGWCYVGPD